MLDNYLLKGCGTALVTPFNEDQTVDYEAFGRMVTRQIDNGIDFLVPLGSTAETPCLEDDEKKKLLALTKELCQGRPVVVGAGTNSLKKTIETIKMLEPYDPDAFLVVVPYYNKPTQDGLLEYFKAVSQSTDKNMVVYNVPGRSGKEIPLDVVARLAKHPNVVAIKEAAGSVDRVSAIKDLCPDFTVLSGDDSLVLPMVSVGAEGVISVASNVIPREMSDFVRLAMAGDMVKAREQHLKYYHLFRDLFIDTNPIMVKEALALMGKIDLQFRLPLCETTDANRAQLRETLAALGLLGVGG